MRRVYIVAFGYKGGCMGVPSAAFTSEAVAKRYAHGLPIPPDGKGGSWVVFFMCLNSPDELHTEYDCG